MPWSKVLFLLLGAVLVAYQLVQPEARRPALAQSFAGTTVPLSDMGTGTYDGFAGGLYENGSDAVPADHSTAGMSLAGAVQPLDASGTPSPSGKIVLLSIGMSNTADEWCGVAGGCTTPSGESFMAQAAGSPSVNHSTLAIVNGAQSGQDARTWVSPTSADYDMVKTQRLEPRGLTEKQVQVIWLKEADENPTTSLPSASADAYTLESDLGSILRAIRVRYPNIKLVFLSSRIYAGYATTPLNPEPYAYESGFAVKWLIGAQIDQMRQGGVVTDPRAGNLNDTTVAPWIAWGPYLWANGTTPRSDGLTWQPSDFQSDGTHPSATGITKVGNALLSFFLTSPYTTCWFTAAGCSLPGQAGTPTVTPAATSTVQPQGTATAAVTGTSTATPGTSTVTPLPTTSATPPAPPTGGPGATSTLPAPPQATNTPAPAATASATLAAPALALRLRSVVSPGEKQSVTVSGPPNALVRMRVRYPNGDHQSSPVHTNAAGHATYTYVQGASKITHRKFKATVIARAQGGAGQLQATATYTIGFGVIDISAEPRTIKPGQTVDLFVHARTGSHVAVLLTAPNGQTLPHTFKGITGPKGFASIKLKLPARTKRSKTGVKIKAIARFASGKPNVSTSTTFTVA